MSALTTNLRPTLRDPFKEPPELTTFEIEELETEFESDTLGNMQTHCPALVDQIDLFTAEIANNKSISESRLVFIAAYIHSARDLAFERFVACKKYSVIEKRSEVDYG